MPGALHRARRGRRGFPLREGRPGPLYGVRPLRKGLPHAQPAAGPPGGGARLRRPEPGRSGPQHELFGRPFLPAGRRDPRGRGHGLRRPLRRTVRRGARRCGNGRGSPPFPRLEIRAERHGRLLSPRAGGVAAGTPGAVQRHGVPDCRAERLPRTGLPVADLRRGGLPRRTLPGRVAPVSRRTAGRSRKDGGCARPSRTVLVPRQVRRMETLPGDGPLPRSAGRNDPFGTVLPQCLHARFPARPVHPSLLSRLSGEEFRLGGRPDAGRLLGSGPLPSRHGRRPGYFARRHPHAPGRRGPARRGEPDGRRTLHARLRAGDEPGHRAVRTPSGRTGTLFRTASPRKRDGRRRPSDTHPAAETAAPPGRELAARLGLKTGNR